MKYNIDDNGNHYCASCGKWIGNHNTGDTPWGNKSYFSIIRTKYCKECRKKVVNSQTAFRLYNLRKRKKWLDKEKLSQLELLKEENELLRLQIIELRKDIYE